MKEKLPRSFLVMVAGVAMVSVILSTPAFAEKNKDKKNKHKDSFSSEIEKEIKKDGDLKKDHSKKQKTKPVDEKNRNADSGVQVFSKAEREAVLNYYSMHSQVLPPGLSRKVARGGNLPPGWQKKIAKGEVLSSDIYKHAESVPEDIMISLPSMAPGTSLVRIDNRIVKVVDATKTIIDVINLP